MKMGKEIPNLKYLTSDYNLVKCGICGRAWDEHPRGISCDTHRPEGIMAEVPIPKATLHNLNSDTPKKTDPPCQDESGFYTRCLMVGSTMIVSR